MRITQRSVTLTSMAGLNRNLNNVSRLQERLTSGKSIAMPSDDPTGTNQSMQIRNDKRATEQHTRNITDAKGWLEQSDSALQTMITMTRDARNVALQGMNTGTMSTSAKQAMSAQVANIRDALLGVANQTIQGRPIFGGVTGGGTAYDATGTYVGDPGAPVTRRLSDTETLRVDVTGPEAFGTGNTDLFAVLSRIATNVAANPAALSADLDDLDKVSEKMLTAAADVGARANRVDRAEQTTADRMLTLESTLSEVEGIDLPKTIMELNMQQVGYQAALQATAKAIQPTLMDFLR